MAAGLDPLGAASLRRCVAGALACLSRLAALLRATAFWGTILLPFVIVGGLASDLARTAPTGLALLFGLNVCCILLGRNYRPGD